MDNTSDSKDVSAKLDSVYKEFKEKMNALKKKQNLIVKRFIENATFKKIEQIKKDFSDKK